MPKCHFYIAFRNGWLVFAPKAFVLMTFPNIKIKAFCWMTTNPEQKSIRTIVIRTIGTAPVFQRCKKTKISKFGFSFEPWPNFLNEWLQQQDLLKIWHSMFMLMLQKGATTLSKMTLSIMTFSIMTFSIMTFGIIMKKHDTQHNDAQH